MERHALLLSEVELSQDTKFNISYVSNRNTKVCTLSNVIIPLARVRAACRASNTLGGTATPSPNQLCKELI